MDKLALIQRLQSLVFQLQILLAQKEKPQGLNNREKLYYAAKKYLGTDASPNDIAPDELGCVESVNAIHKACFGFEIGGGVSTYRLYPILINSPLFVKVDSPLRGDIIISPTGYSDGQGTIKNGHVGILSDNGLIMSNNSKTGLWDEHISLNLWRDRYVLQGHYPQAYFRRV